MLATVVGLVAAIAPEASVAAWVSSLLRGPRFAVAAVAVLDVLPAADAVSAVLPPLVAGSVVVDAASAGELAVLVFPGGGTVFDAVVGGAGPLGLPAAIALKAAALDCATFAVEDDDAEDVVAAADVEEDDAVDDDEAEDDVEEDDDDPDAACDGGAFGGEGGGEVGVDVWVEFPVAVVAGVAEAFVAVAALDEFACCCCDCCGGEGVAVDCGAAVTELESSRSEKDCGPPGCATPPACVHCEDEGGSAVTISDAILDTLGPLPSK